MISARARTNRFRVSLLWEKYRLNRTKTNHNVGKRALTFHGQDDGDFTIGVHEFFLRLCTVGASDDTISVIGAVVFSFRKR